MNPLHQLTRVMELGHSIDITPVLAALCGGDTLGFFGVATGLFTLGLLGGALHCAPMCGPFVLMQLAEPGGGLMVGRLALSALPGYQLGRMTTYVVLGAVFAGLGSAILDAAHWRLLAGALLGLAALSLLAQAAKNAGLKLPTLPFSPLGARLAGPLTRPIEHLLRMRRFRLRGYGLGLLLGLLPCGLLYTAIAAAAATGSAAAGGLAMAAFAIGTMPALMTVGLVGAGALRRWRRPLGQVATPLFLFNALLLAGLALRSTL